MLELIKINIQNLASIKEQSYYFKEELATIVGINKDTSNVNSNISDEELIKLPLLNLKSNGSGKTTIVEALHICLLGSCIREKINLRDLIRNGEESMKIELVCKNLQLGLSKIRIIREIFKNQNKTSKVEIFERKEGGQEEIQIPRTSSEGMDNYILNHYIGLSKEDIDNFFIIQRDKFKSFISLPDQKKKDILSRFTGISNFGFVEEELEEEIKSWRQDKENKEKEISKFEGQKESYQEMINEMPNQKDFEKEKQDRIEKVKIEISRKKEDNKKKEKENLQFDKEIIKLKEDLIFWQKRQKRYSDYIKNHPFEEQFTKLRKEKGDINKDIKEINEAISVAEDLKKGKKKSKDQIEVVINKYKTLLKNLIKCPHCNFEFNPGDNTSKEDINKVINKESKKESEINEEIQEINNDLKELGELLEVKNKSLEEVGAKIDALNNRKDRITDIGEYIDSKISDIQRKIEKLNDTIGDNKSTITFNSDSIKNFEKQIESIEKETFESAVQNIKKYKDNIKKIDKDIKVKSEERDNIDKQIQLSKDSILNYGLFKNYLYNKIILQIECVVNNYLQSFSDLCVQIKGNKTLADGKSVRDEITCLISRKGEEISYFLLSSGEKAFIDISFILTFQKILNATSNNGLDFLILDEITGTVDCANQEELLQSINVIKKPILFITHIPTISDFNTTYIIKENNTSRII